MTYTLIWRHAAVARLIRLRTYDPLTAKAVRTIVATLAAAPTPTPVPPLGSPTLRRLRVGPARIMYTVDEDKICVDILTVGRTSG